MNVKQWFPLFMLPLFLAGCAVTTPEYPAGRLSEKPGMPGYQIGDTFIFSDGTVEKVVALHGDRIDWESRGGSFRYSTYPNFILPKRSWETERRKVVVEYSGDTGLLWPLQEGQSGYVPTIVTVMNKPHLGAKNYLQSWYCHTGGIYKITVAAGTFDAQKIECQRFTLMQRWMQTRTWYYAPSIGHYVLQQDEYAPTSSRTHIERERTLVALIPADTHLETENGITAEGHFQQVMETLHSGESSEWKDQSDHYSRVIEVQRSFRTSDQRYCREYQMRRRDDGQIRQYRGTACRGEDGAWRVAVAHPGPEGGIRR